MAGTQNFLLAVGMGETDKVRKMLRQLAPVTIAFANAQFAAGADIVVLADHATRNLVGPHHYEEYLLPIHQEITAQVGGPIILHVCGNCSEAGLRPARHWVSRVTSAHSLRCSVQRWAQKASPTSVPSQLGAMRRMLRRFSLISEPSARRCGSL
jgi:uroporphyrinogen-III decarboxylase